MGVQSTLCYTAEEIGTGNRTLVMVYGGLGGSTTEQEGGTNPFPVVGLSEVTCFRTMKQTKYLLAISNKPHQP